MLVARWQIDARFGHKQAVVDILQSWLREMGSKAGTGAMDVKVLHGSVGALESRVEANHSLESLAQLEQVFGAIDKHNAHKQWAKDLEPYVVSGTPRWEIFRVA